MSDPEGSSLTDVLVLLRDIRANQKPARFNPGSAMVAAVAAAIGLCMGFAIKDALQSMFDLIPCTKNSLFSKWLYAVIVVFISMILLFTLYVYIEPHLTAKFQRHH